VRARMGARSATGLPRIAIIAHHPRIRRDATGTPVAVSACVALLDQRRLHPSRNTKASISGDGLVLLDVDGGLVLSANAVGARIWQLIEQRRTPAEIAQHLVEDYDIPAERAAGDVATFVTSLIERGLVAQDSRS
jgi:hypothetical protein